MSYQTTWKNTVIKVVSVIEIAISVLAIISAIMVIAGGFSLGGSSSALINEATTEYGADLQTAQEGAEIIANSGMAAGIAGIILLVASAIDLVAGIFGFRGANNPAKITPFIFFTVVGLLLSVTTLVTNIMGGTFVWTSLIPIAMSLFLLYLAFSVRSEYEASLKKPKRKKK